MRQMLLAIQFLTIIPVKVRGEVAEKDLVASTIFFPVAGALQGLLMAVTALAGLQVFPPEVVSGLVILVHLLTNGGFDLDGLIDTFDALAVKSAGDPAKDIEKRLAVMKDSTIGAMGAIAMVMTILLKFFLLNALFHSVPLTVTLCMLFLMPSFSKWVTVPAMSHGISARRDGLGRIFLDNVRLFHVALSTLLIFTLYLSATALHLYRIYGMRSIGLLAVLFLSLYLFSLLSVSLSLRKFGGLTGDNFGAMSEISEILFLMVASSWLRYSA
ncbi:MAG: adenosylcobinamide-GDP ribazoletransferase [Nitrospirae bacterium]|nr:adenosylcobinamide-GDP ribazoletransferase [Nitrospirota bacterium]MCL5422585.1 adenosylcobinamide-GDP ribazoletransferase [Nitrospirota bacterium]